MAHFYDLPGGAAAGMADAKMPDAQAGYEKAVSNTMAGLAGVNMIYESAGMLASLLGFCLESLIIDNDMIGQCLRTVRGIEVSEGSLSLETMRSVCLEGPGHYLGHERTLELMEREFVYPNLADRSSPKEWVENSKPELLVRARAERIVCWQVISRVTSPTHWIRNYAANTRYGWNARRWDLANAAIRE
jgi:trimethylamine--corrinoid protein Co-methyltransferase